MKYKKTLITFIVVTMGLILFSCGTSQTALEKAQQAELLSEHIKNFNFKFKATHAYPQNYKSIYLSSIYDVTVSPDTIKAYLPYYGRAYTPPMNPSDGGIKFVSTKFDYEVQAGKKSGNWLVRIHTKDTNRGYTLVFDLWENGKANLNVSHADKQSISFQGDVIPLKKEK